jgi:hypothetical protein
MLENDLRSCTRIATRTKQAAAAIRLEAHNFLATSSKKFPIE